MATLPPDIEPFPPPVQRGDKQTFSRLFDGVITWFVKHVGNLGQACMSAYLNAVAAAASASAAAAAAEAAIFASVATQWVSGTTYAKGVVVWSPTRGTYRRLIAGAGTTDPYLDRVNWELMSFESSLLASATVTAPVANIDFLNIFNSNYDCYTVEVQGLQGSLSGRVLVRLSVATAGVVDNSSISQMGSGESIVSSTAPDGLNLGYIEGPATVRNSLTLSLKFRNVNSPTADTLKSISARGVSLTNSGGGIQIINRDTGFANAAPLSGFRISLSGGNITVGKIRIYGARNN